MLVVIYASCSFSNAEEVWSLDIRIESETENVVQYRFDISHIT